MLPTSRADFVFLAGFLSAYSCPKSLVSFERLHSRTFYHVALVSPPLVCAHSCPLLRGADSGSTNDHGRGYSSKPSFDGMWRYNPHKRYVFKSICLSPSRPNLIICNSEKIFKASDVKACLLSVPFNAAVATRFISYYKDTLQFHSTLGYLKSPPSSYQQPATDLVGGLDNIQIGIDNGAYKNQYTFEVALQKLIFSAHDDHLTLVSGILGVFQFGSGVYIASVSKDGTSLPEPYLVGKKWLHS